MTTAESAANAVVAAVQATPVFLDRDATVDRACELTAKAAAAGASLVVFPEAFVPGYPDWVWRTPAWSDGKLTGRLLANAVEVPSPSVDRLGAAAAAVTFKSSSFIRITQWCPGRCSPHEMCSASLQATTRYSSRR